MTGELRIAEEVQEQLHCGGALVVLESAVVTAGLPREPFADGHAIETRVVGVSTAGWDDRGTANLELARAMERAVRAAGAVPATAAVMKGEFRLGLSLEELHALADNPHAGKVASRDLAHAVVNKATAGTTVSATLAVIQMFQHLLAAHARAAGRASTTPGAVFATGGIGGVHRGWSARLDVSADLRAMARTRACIVCAGVKSILDVPATLEALEALEVPVVGYRTDVFPQFQSLGAADIRVPCRVDRPQDVAGMCMAHWGVIGHHGSVLVAQPVPSEFAMNQDELDRAVESCEQDADASGIRGAARTPWLLRALAERTGGNSLAGNIALLLNNARLAGQVAVALADVAGT